MDTSIKKPEPIHCIEKIKAANLYNKKVLCAQDKEGLGYYAKLIGIDDKTGKFICKLDASGYIGSYEWIVEDITFPIGGR